MDAATRDLIAALHQAPRQAVLVFSGGGATAAAQLLTVPGGSRTILEVVVPYHEQALADFLGHRPDQFCSSATAALMARRAHERARWLAPAEPVLGLGGTASLASDRPKRGEHRVHLACSTDDRLTTWSLTLNKGARDRAGEEALVSAAALNLLAAGFGIPQRLALPLLEGEKPQEEQTAGSGLARFFAGEVPLWCVERDGRQGDDFPRPRAVLPGAFNPIHDAHWSLAATAARLLGVEVAFELSVDNVDKPSLSLQEVQCRAVQFAWRAPLWLTRAPTFAAKGKLFPGAVFVVGADTAARIVAARYYDKGEAGVAEALTGLRDASCRFLVAGRCDAGGRFLGLEDLAIPAEYHDLFTGIPAAEFRIDLSSTQLREQYQRSHGPSHAAP